MTFGRDGAVKLASDIEMVEFTIVPVELRCDKPPIWRYHLQPGLSGEK
jgi:hypothetical protein